MVLKGFKPFDDLIVIERDAPESQIGSIIIPVTAQNEVDQGTIVAKGPGKRSEKGTILPMDTREGDRVLFSKYANLTFELNGKQYVTMREADLIGIIGE